MDNEKETTMSDVMLFGVLRMPYELAMGDELSRVQFYGRAQQAADEIERLRADLDAALMIVIDLGGGVRTPEFDEAVALRKDAERYRLLRMGHEGEALPEAAHTSFVTDSVMRQLKVRSYSANQMRDYAAAAVAAERERCAKVCELKAWEWDHSAGHPTEELRAAADEIRGPPITPSQPPL